MNTPLPLPVLRVIKDLGANLSLARRRRHLSQAMLAERIGASTMTVSRMEAGNPNLSLQHLARALHVFGQLDRLDHLLDTAADSVGLTLMDDQLPVRVRAPKQGKDRGAQ